MSLQVTESHTGSGLYVAEQAVGDDAVARLLREHDSRLRLVPQWGGAGRSVLWQVYAYNGPDRDADHVCSWQTPDGEPLPLSSRLLEMVQQHDRRTRGQTATVKELNEKHLAGVAKDRRNALDAVADDYRPYIDRGRTSVSLGQRPTYRDSDR